MFKVDENTKALLHFNNKSNLLKDECGNVWTAHGTPLKFYNEDPYVGGSAFFDLDSCISLTNLNNLITIDSPFTIECLFSLKKTAGSEKSYYSNRYLFQCYNIQYSHTDDNVTRGWFSVYFHPLITNYHCNHDTRTGIWYNASSFCGEQIYPWINLKDVTSNVNDTESYTDDKVIYANEDSWHHIAISRNGNYLRIHLDGFLVYNVNVNSRFNWIVNKTTYTYYLRPGSIFRFGNAGNNLGTSNSFFGYISELRISDCDRYGGVQNFGKYSNIHNEFVSQTLLSYNSVVYRFPYTYTQNGKTLTAYYSINDMLNRGSVRQWPINTRFPDIDKNYLYYRKNLEEQYSGKTNVDTFSIVEEDINRTDYTSEDYLIIYPEWASEIEYRKFKYYPLLITNKSQKKYYFYPYNMDDDGETSEDIMDSLASFIFTEEEDFIKYPYIDIAEDSININNVDYRLRVFGYYPLFITNKTQKKYYYYYINQDYEFNSFEEVMENIELFDLGTEEEEEFTATPGIQLVDTVTVNNVNLPVRAFNCFPLLITNENKKKYYHYLSGQSNDAETFDEIMENIKLFDLGTEEEEEFTATPEIQLIDTVTVNNVNLPVRAFKYYPLLITNENKKKFQHYPLNIDDEANTFDEIMEGIALFVFSEEEEEFTAIPEYTVVENVKVNNVDLPVRAFKYYPLLITNENKKKFQHYPLNIDDEANTFDEIMEGIALFVFSEEEEEFTALPRIDVVDTVRVNGVDKKTTAFNYYPLLITNENEKKYYYWLFNQNEAFDSFEEVMKYIELFSEFEDEPEEKKEITIRPIEKFRPDNGNEEKYFDTDPLSKGATGNFFKYFFNLTDTGDEMGKYISKIQFDTLKVPIIILQNDTKLIIKDDFPIFMAYRYL